MKNTRNLTLSLLCITALIGLLASGCNTANGFGKDVQKAGEGIQDGTK